MNVLLANMPTSFNNKESLEPPLGIAYLAAILKKEGHKVILKDFEVEHYSEEAVRSVVKNSSIDLVGVSFRTASYKCAKIFISSIKKYYPNIKIVVGGHHATAFPEATIFDMGCDIVVRGEGEFTFLNLLKQLESNHINLSDVEGISFKRNNMINHCGDADLIPELDVLPFPERDLLPMDKYTVVTIISSRGCPFSCIYCDKGISTRNVRYRSVDNLFEELCEIHERYLGKKIYFVDDSFFLNRKRALKLFKKIIEKNLKLNWVCQARADQVDEELLSVAERAGCEEIIYGLETGDSEELIYINKKITLEQAERAVMLTKKVGIKTRANFMIGFPISTHRSTKNTIKFAEKINLDKVRFFAVSPLPNTLLWEYVYGDNMNPIKCKWDQFDFYNPVFDTIELSRSEVNQYTGAAYLYLLKNKAFKEISISFIPNLITLLRLWKRNKRIRGNLSSSFPALVNLVFEIWFTIKNKSFIGKYQYLRDIIKLEKIII